MLKVFISFSHAQRDWVKNDLVPVLKAGGVEPLVDWERFTAGHRLTGQMDTAQDQADRHLICLSQEYVKSDYCLHELERACNSDSDASRGIVIPVRLDATAVPSMLQTQDRLWVDLTDRRREEPWQQLLKACDADLGISAPAWLEARDEVVFALRRPKSVNLVVPNKKVRWRELLDHIQQDYFSDFAKVDMQDGRTATREGLLLEMLEGLGMCLGELPRKPRDLAVFTDALLTRAKSRVMLTHFDMVLHRKTYGVDLFAGLRWLIMEGKRPLVLLAQSHTPFAELLPRYHPLSEIDLVTVELK